MLRVWMIVGVIATLMMGVTGTGSAASPLNYGDFSMMGARSAGQHQVVSDASGWRGQWAWEPQGGMGSRIRWGTPGEWPPSTYERFSRSQDGLWVLLEGFGGLVNGEDVFYRQVVTSEKRGDVNCRNMKPLALDGSGRQHYALWQVTGVASYCLEAWGYIEVGGGTRVDFYHKQVRFAPSMPGACSNRWISGRTCIKQYEEWFDNNCQSFGGECDGPLQRRVWRDVVLAGGLGPAFYIHNWDSGWESQGVAYWRY